ncbi:MAG TPA: PIN domain-containing protein [Terriglobia bacterium]|nr:PIN domain-containing protein [Terriglobia bacterium]
MKTKKRPVPPAVPAFWDTSAIVPLCCFQSQTSDARKAARIYARQITWWATSVEATSAFNRLFRERILSQAGKQQALARLDYLRHRWNEIQPANEVRENAERLLGVHRLRAADALQLAAALMWCNYHPSERPFIAGDEDLAAAAEAERFTVIRV